MPNFMPHVVILITCYNGRQYLDDLFNSLRDCASANIKQTIVMVDNASTDRSGEDTRTNFPFVDIVRLEPNAGFTGGNNFGYQHIKQVYPDADYIVLLNTDTVVTPGWLEPLVAVMKENLDVGSVQPKILLHDQPDRINTAGNRSHILGFGMMTGYNFSAKSYYNTQRNIAFPSGCCVMLRVSLLKEIGLFDTEYFMYLEDAELGWKIRLAGYKNLYCPEAQIYHKYIANAPYKYFYYLERNRFLLLLTYYQLSMILLLLPLIFLMEMGMIVFSLLIGKLPDKLRSYAYFLKQKNLKRLEIKRKMVQKNRKINDLSLTSIFVTSIDIPTGSPFLLRYVAVPLMTIYWRIIRGVMVLIHKT